MSFGRRWPGNSVRFRTDYLFRNGNDGYGGALWCWTLLQTPHLRIANGGNAAASSIGGGFLPFRRRPQRKRREFGLPYLTRTDGEPGGEWRCHSNDGGLPSRPRGTRLRALAFKGGSPHRVPF